MNASDVILGKRYGWSRHSGFDGVAISRIEYTTGCSQILLQDTYTDKDGVPQTFDRWIDDSEVVKVYGEDYGPAVPFGGSVLEPLASLPPEKDVEAKESVAPPGGPADGPGPCGPC